MSTLVTSSYDPAVRPETIARSRIEAGIAIAFGVALTLFMQGYQFGRSNHTVYLLDALRRVEPGLLQNDWFTTQTLQYHAVFGWVTRELFRLGAVAPAFMIGYLGLVVLMHVAWWRLVRLLGGGTGTFVLSVLTYQVSAAGTALGNYQILQDSAFLPSNIAAVAMLWMLTFRLDGRNLAAGLCLGLAGLFHLNYALVAVPLWGLLVAGEMIRRRAARVDRTLVLATIAALGPSLVNIALAWRVTSQQTGRMPLAEFVDLYVRLRHPHHYDPSSWPAWLWVSFLLPMPLAVAAWRGARADPALRKTWDEAARIFLIFCGLIVIALAGAGAVYVSETLVQASLYRFSVFPKLLGCIGAAFLVERVARRWKIERAVTACAACAGLVLMCACAERGPYLGMFRLVHDDPPYDAVCDWARQNTPADAVFLVPPQEEDFRLRARRAIVINFKGVPQLSGEFPEWRDRLRDVLDLPDLRVLPTPFASTLAAIRDRYEALPPAHLEAVSRKYGARYVLVGHRISEWEARRVDVGANPEYFLYDLSR
jgi:hypothetical protein